MKNYNTYNTFIEKHNPHHKKTNVYQTYNTSARYNGSVASKIVAILVLLVLMSWAVHWLFNATWQSAINANPYPKDPVVTTTKFFKALQKRNYKECYSLLTAQRKIATAISTQSRSTYNAHFERIRAYLVKMIGNNFADNMEISTNGQVVKFNKNVELTLTLIPDRGIDNVRHYAIDQINEFPEDVAPGLGIEQHNRRVNQVIESGGTNLNVQNYDDIAAITAKRHGETPADRLRRFLNTFHYARQLDTRQAVLQWLIKEFPKQPATINLLTKIAKDKRQLPQLRLQAQQGLNYIRNLKN